MSYDDQFRLGAHAVLTNPEGKILLLKATYGEMDWGLPGGSLDPAETIHEALIRECQEELGILVEVLYMSGIYYHRIYNSHSCIFRCTMPENSNIILSSEHSAYRYFSLAELNAVQRQRIQDCFLFDGKVKSARF